MQQIKQPTKQPLVSDNIWISGDSCPAPTWHYSSFKADQRRGFLTQGGSAVVTCLLHVDLCIESKTVSRFIEIIIQMRGGLILDIWHWRVKIWGFYSHIFYKLKRGGKWSHKNRESNVCVWASVFGYLWTDLLWLSVCQIFYYSIGKLELGVSYLQMEKLCSIFTLSKLCKSAIL